MHLFFIWTTGDNETSIDEVELDRYTQKKISNWIDIRTDISRGSIAQNYQLWQIYSMEKTVVLMDHVLVIHLRG